MRIWKTSIVIAVAGVAVAASGSMEGWGSAAAADKPRAADKSRAADVDKPSDTRTTESNVRRDDSAMRPHPGGLIEANWLIGTRLHDASGDEIGKIAHLWLDPKTGQVKDVIVSMGATLGVGGRDKVIAWKDLKINWKDQKLFVSADPKALRDAYQTKMDRDDRGPAASPRTPERRR